MANSILHSKISDFVDSECPICTASFEDSVHIPLIICVNQHTYCKKCIPTLLKMTKQCPECRQPTVSSPKPNRVLLDVIQFQRVQLQKNGKISTEHSAEQTTQDKSQQGSKYLNENNKQIKFLSLKRKNIQCINGLKKYQALQFLSLNQNYITKIKRLPKAQNLKYLYFKSNKIQNIEGLQYFANLQKLSLANNNIQKIQGLSTLKNLKHLFLQSNQIKKIENFDHLTKLQTLNLSFNKIKVIENLSKLKSLKCLSLQANIIQVIEGLEDSHLKVLVLDNNEIINIPTLPRKLRKLEVLSLCINKIEQVSDCPGLFNFNFFKQQYEVQLDNPQAVFLKGNGVCTKLQLVAKVEHHTKAILKPTIVI